MTETQRYEFIIEGMRCAACATRLERVLNRHRALHAEVSFASAQAVIIVKTADEEDKKELEQEDTSLQALIRLIEDAGFHAEILEEYDLTQIKEDYLKEGTSLRRNFILSLLCTIPIMLLMMGPFWLVLFLMSVVQFWCGRFFYKYAYHALKNKMMTMDVLVALGTSIAYFYNVFAIFASFDFYPDASAMVISLVLLGRLLEHKAKYKARSGIQSLLQAQPMIAHKEVGTKIEDCPITELTDNDVIIARPGEIIAVDGVIIEGQSEINESLLTGESVPVLRKEGDKVFAATLNHHAILRIKVVATGRKTEFSKIVHFVEKAQASKPQIQKIADNVTAYFVPVIVLCAILSFCGTFLWGGVFSASLLHAVAVLVVACPCALGLATPMTLMVGTAKGTELGILFQNSQILEQSCKITAMILDKTGTLTEGKPSLASLYSCSSYDEKFLLSCAFALERDSEHPLAHAVREAFRERGGEMHCLTTSFSSPLMIIPGKGISAELEGGGCAYIGKEEFLLEHGLTLPSALVGWLEEERQQARISILIAWKGAVIGGLSFIDSLRPDAASLVMSLKKRHIMPVMVTGDHLILAENIAKDVGIECVKAGILPEGKVEIIRTLQKQGHVVGMIGDGLNDAPALSIADLSIAMGHGSGLSLDASDIILMRNHLSGLEDSLELSSVILRRIYQNLALAFIYNIICVPLAALGFLSPMLASICMGVSSLSVVLNALRLRWWSPKNRA